MGSSSALDFTYNDYFNYYLKEFLNKLVSSFPEFERAIVNNYRPILEGKDDKNDMYVKFYYTKINNYLTQIAKRDRSLMLSSEQPLIFIEGLDFRQLWKSPNMTVDTELSIWKYLQILMIIGRKSIPQHNEMVELLNKVSGGEINIPAKLDHILSGDDEDENKGMDMSSIFSSLSSLNGLINGGGIDLAGVSEMLKPLMESMGSFMSQPSASDGGGDASVSGGGEASASGGSEASASGGGDAEPSKIFSETGLFGELAKEMSQTFDFDKLAAESDGQEPQLNIGDAFKKLMSGDNTSKLMNLVGKFSGKLQSEISSGRLNQADLLKETLGMMGNMQNNPMAAAAAAAAGLNRASTNATMNRANQVARTNTTRDRLKAKLEAKQQQNNPSQ